MTRQTDAGFTLIEALVAMAVLALGAVSLLSATEDHTRRIGDLTERVAARWAAEYQLSHLRAGLDPMDDPVDFYGISFTVTHDRQPTDDPELEKVTVRAARADNDRVLYILDGYIDTGGAI